MIFAHTFGLQSLADMPCWSPLPTPACDLARSAKESDRSNTWHAATQRSRRGTPPETPPERGSSILGNSLSATRSARLCSLTYAKASRWLRLCWCEDIPADCTVLEDETSILPKGVSMPAALHTQQPMAHGPPQGGGLLTIQQEEPPESPCDSKANRFRHALAACWGASLTRAPLRTRPLNAAKKKQRVQSSPTHSFECASSSESGAAPILGHRTGTSMGMSAGSPARGQRCARTQAAREVKGKDDVLYHVHFNFNYLHARRGTTSASWTRLPHAVITTGTMGAHIT